MIMGDKIGVDLDVDKEDHTIGFGIGWIHGRCSAFIDQEKDADIEDNKVD